MPTPVNTFASLYKPIYLCIDMYWPQCIKCISTLASTCKVWITLYIHVCTNFTKCPLDGNILYTVQVYKWFLREFFILVGAPLLHCVAYACTYYRYIHVHVQAFMDKLVQQHCNATHCNALQCTHSLFDVAKETYKIKTTTALW